jgi:predicted ATPase
MIERIYIDNVRSFANFEWKPDRLAMLLGPNGAGKTSLLETIFALRSFVLGDANIAETFPESSRTREDQRFTQTIELDVSIAAATYHYRLVVEQDPKGLNDPLVAEETLQAGQGLIENKSKDLSVYRGTQARAIPGTRPTRSLIGRVPTGTEASFVLPFQEWIYNLWLLRPDPRAMTSRTDRRRVSSAPWLERDMSNFAAWYPPTLASRPRDMGNAIRAVEPALPGLVELRDLSGTLEAVFERGGRTTSYAFDELSDGERALVAAYVVLHVVASPGKVLLIDEPDNYVGLREIQPWLAELCDRVLRSDGPQVMLVSHHPDVLNFLAPEHGWTMFREERGPTRIERFQADGGLDPAEAAARGWGAPK